jgi:hypothetical protein
MPRRAGTSVLFDVSVSAGAAAVSARFARATEQILGHSAIWARPLGKAVQ